MAQEANEIAPQVDVMEVIQEIRNMQNGEVILELAVQKVINRNQQEMIKQLLEQTGSVQPEPAKD